MNKNTNNLTLPQSSNPTLVTKVHGYPTHECESKAFIVKQPLYIQIYKQVRDNIIAGDYPYGSKLPSKRSLADKMGVSTITVEHAYMLLCDEGYVEARERSGFIVIFRKDDGFAISFEHLEKSSVYREISSSIVETAVSSDYDGSYEMINVDYDKSSQSDLPTTVFTRAVRKVMTEYSSILLEKSPATGVFLLRDAIRRYLARNRGIHVRAEQIIIGAGSEYLYRLITELLGRDLIYGIESPSYKKIEQVYKAAGITYTYLPLTDSGIDSKALSATNAHVLHTTPYRSYPSGVTATASKRFEYIHWSGKENRYIIEDDYESEFSVSTKPIDTLFVSSPYNNVIYLNTFSKTISSSIRIGYMVLPEHLVDEFNLKLGFYSCTVPTLMQYVITVLLNSGDFERHINRVRRRNRKG